MRATVFAVRQPLCFYANTLALIPGPSPASGRRGRVTLALVQGINHIGEEMIWADGDFGRYTDHTPSRCMQSDVAFGILNLNPLERVDATINLDHQTL